MSIPFDRQGKLIVVPVMISGPIGVRAFDFALDTGTSRTMVHPERLVEVGYVPEASSRRISFRGVTGAGAASIVEVETFAALDTERVNFPLLSFAFDSKVDGLLGLDFLRGRVQTIDFTAGQITLK